MASKFEHTNVREFTLQYLKQITNNFSQEHIIGQGGFGVVYKGVLHNGEEIALKKINYKSELDDMEFRNEFTNIMRAQHPNITRLVGYCYNLREQRVKYNDEYICVSEEERVLCFEYLPGSLDKHITDISDGLDWCTRFKIIKGICEGLNYLHNGSTDPIFHLDLKPENILLDKSMIPKIADFGLSKLFLPTQTNDTSQFAGTLGYMPPEYIDRSEITDKFDVFSLGGIIIRIMAGKEGYSRYREMSQDFFEHVWHISCIMSSNMVINIYYYPVVGVLVSVPPCHPVPTLQVHGNWGKRLQATMSSLKSEEVKTCIKIALRCVEDDGEKRPSIAEIVDELNDVSTAESSSTEQVTNSGSKLNQNSNSEHRGRIAFSTTYRPPVPLDIFSCSLSPSSTEDELLLTDGVSYNYNGRPIPPDALKTLLRNPKVANESGATDADIDAGHVYGFIFVSERYDGLETLHIALRFSADSKVKIFSLADIFGPADFCGARLEDSGCFGGGCSVGSQTSDHCLIYVSTKEPVQRSRSPWTVMYKTNLRTGVTRRLTPPGQFDLSPAVSPSGRKVAMANFRMNEWNGEMENLNTDICVMNVDRDKRGGLGRSRIIRDGGWPSWGSDNIIFFHRCATKPSDLMGGRTSWGVFKYNISTKETFRVTPEELDAVTPAAISETKVAVATIREKFIFGQSARVEAQYRHIEIFDTSTPGLPPVHITQNTRPKGDHYNPFVLDGGSRIGYHRCLSDHLRHGDRVHRNLYKLESPLEDIGLYRVSGMSPTISVDGSKLAFIDNEFKAVWVADSQGLRIVFKSEGGLGYVFSPVWNQNPAKDILYVCVGPSFRPTMSLEIYAIHIGNQSDVAHQQVKRLTHGGFNNAFPSSSPDGNEIVYRSTRGGVERGQKNLYIMSDTGETEVDHVIVRLTNGPWTDTQCQWSPNGDWIVFSSTRDEPLLSGYSNHVLDPGFFSVYLVKARDPTVVIRVIGSGDIHSGHVNHPVFSPDGRSIAVAADLAAVSVDPISLPWYLHAVRPYGDIFVVDIDPDDLKNRDVKVFRRMTHSRYECGTPAWTSLFTTPAHAQWNMLLKLEDTLYKPECPYVHPDGGESWHMTGHLSIPNLR